MESGQINRTGVNNTGNYRGHCGFAGTRSDIGRHPRLTDCSGFRGGKAGRQAIALQKGEVP